MKTYFLKEKGINSVILLLIACESCFKMTSAVLDSYFLNSIIRFDIHSFAIVAVLKVCVWLLYILIYFVEHYLRGKAIQEMSLALRADISTVLSRSSYLCFHRKSTNTYASWLTNDVTMIEDRGFSNVYYVAGLITDPIVSIIALMKFHWSIVVLTLISSVITTIAPQVLRRQMQKANISITQENERFLSKVGDALEGFDTLFSFHLLDKLAESVILNGKRLGNKKVHQNTVDTASAVIGAAANVTSQELTTILTGYLAFQKIISIGAVATTGSLASNVYNGLANLGPAINTIRGVMPLFDKYQLNTLHNYPERSDTAIDPDNSSPV